MSFKFDAKLINVECLDIYYLEELQLFVYWQNWSIISGYSQMTCSHLFTFAVIVCVKQVPSSVVRDLHPNRVHINEIAIPTICTYRLGYLQTSLMYCMCCVHGLSTSWVQYDYKLMSLWKEQFLVNVGSSCLAFLWNMKKVLLHLEKQWL